MPDSKTPRQYFQADLSVDRMVATEKIAIKYEPSDALYKRFKARWFNQELVAFKSWAPAKLWYKQHRAVVPGIDSVIAEILSDEAAAAVRPQLESHVQFLPVVVCDRKKKHAPFIGWIIHPLVVVDCTDWQKTPWKAGVNRHGKTLPNLNEHGFHETTLRLDRIPPNVHYFTVKYAVSATVCSGWLAGQLRKFSANRVAFRRITKVTHTTAKRRAALRFPPVFQPPRPVLKSGPLKPIAEPLPPHSFLAGITGYSHGKPATRAEISSLEKATGIKLPSQIADFLLKVGGVEIEATEIFGGSGRRVNPCKAILKLQKDARSLWKHTWDKDALAIAEDGRGGYFTIHCDAYAKKRGDPSVVHFDHEFIDLSKKKPVGYRIANTFKQWLKALAEGEGY